MAWCQVPVSLRMAHEAHGSYYCSPVTHSKKLRTKPRKRGEAGKPIPPVQIISVGPIREACSRFLVQACDGGWSDEDKSVVPFAGEKTLAGMLSALGSKVPVCGERDGTWPFAR